MGRSPHEKWREAIRRTVLDLFPELERGLHLPIRAKVVAVLPVAAGGSSREHYGYSAAVQPLRPDGSEDTGRPIIPDVPLPKIWGGPGGRGIYALPAVGSIVRLAFDYGDPTLPHIAAVLPEGEDNADAMLNELVIRWSSTSEIRMKPDGTVAITSATGVLIGGADNAQALGDGLKGCLLALIAQVKALCTASTTMGSVLAPTILAELALLEVAINLNAGDGEICSLIHKTSKL